MGKTVRRKAWKRGWCNCEWEQTNRTHQRVKAETVSKEAIKEYMNA